MYSAVCRKFSFLLLLLLLLFLGHSHSLAFRPPIIASKINSERKRSNELDELNKLIGIFKHRAVFFSFFSFVKLFVAIVSYFVPCIISTSSKCGKCFNAACSRQIMFCWFGFVSRSSERGNGKKKIIVCNPADECFSFVFLLKRLKEHFSTLG